MRQDNLERGRLGETLCAQAAKYAIMCVVYVCGVARKSFSANPVASDDFGVDKHTPSESPL